MASSNTWVCVGSRWSFLWRLVLDPNEKNGFSRSLRGKTREKGGGKQWTTIFPWWSCIASKLTETLYISNISPWENWVLTKASKMTETHGLSSKRVRFWLPWTCTNMDDDHDSISNLKVEFQGEHRQCLISFPQVGHWSVINSLHICKWHCDLDMRRYSLTHSQTRATILIIHLANFTS